MKKRLSKIKIQAIETKAELLMLAFVLGFCFSLLQSPPMQKITAPALQFTASLIPELPSFSSNFVSAPTQQYLSDLFKAHDYHLSDVAEGESDVPPVFLTALPGDLHTIAVAQDKKDLFIRAVLPTILLVNQQIAEKRQKLIELESKYHRIGLTASEAQWVSELAEEYELVKGDWKSLLARVDVIPTSMAIAQAAEESGWGTSRFARDGNSLYGQQIYKADKGMMPNARDAGKAHLVRSFDSIYDTVQSYAKNLNTHAAYADFRARRVALHSAQKPLDSEMLVETLTSYSERRGAYVKALKQIIRVNDLKSLDRARLEGQKMAAADAAVRG